MVNTRKRVSSRKSNKFKRAKKTLKNLRALLMKLKKQNKKQSKVKRINIKTRKGRRMRGGYGKGACPFVGPPWNAKTGGNYYSYNRNGVGVGGVNPFSGNNSPSPQHGGSGGLWQQLITNPTRELTGSLGNIINTYDGRHSTPSPNPDVQHQLKPRGKLTGAAL